MKKTLLLIALFFVAIGFSQTNGITYQAIILNPAGEQLPGINNASTPISNKSICLQFSFIDHNTLLEYVETIQTTTDGFGMVNLVIGSGVQVGGYATNFSDILWNSNAKSLKVELDTKGLCSNYIEISNQPFTYVPFAKFALNTENTADIEANALAISVLQSDVVTNQAASNAADTNLQNNISNLASTTSTSVTNLQNSIDNLQVELDATQVGTGLNTDGSYTANPATNYLQTSNSLVNATEKLDNELKTANNLIVTNALIASNAISLVQSDVDANQIASQNADAVLQNNIDSLANTTSIADAALQNNINALAVATSNADTTLQNNINAVQSDVDANQIAS